MAGPITLEQARQILMGAVPRVAPSSGLPWPLAGGSGHVTAEDSLAPTDLPAFDRSLVDGFAVRSADGLTVPVLGEVTMGQPIGALPPGSAFAIPTGGMVPEGADAIVMKEHVTVANGYVTIHRAPTPGQNLVRRGADARAGDVVVPAGRRLRPPDVAMLATVAVAHVRVRPHVRIAVLSTGDELVPHGTVPGPSQVPDSNGPSLCAALQRDGADPSYLGIVRDDYGAVLAAVRDALSGYDALLCTGGSSVGDRDFVQQALNEVTGRPLFSGISIRPGRPTAAFVSGEKWAVALPGHAVSALVVYELLVRDAVLLAGGEKHPRPRGFVQAKLTEDVRAPADRDLFERVRLDGDVAVPLRGASATIGNLARADALVRCPAGATLAKGGAVPAMLLD